MENLRPESTRREVEASLRRLQTDHIDLLQFHDPDPGTPIEESWRAMEDLVRKGKVCYGGLSNHPIELLERAMKIGQVTSNQLEFSPLERSIERGDDAVLSQERNRHTWLGVPGGGLFDRQLQP